MTPTEPAPPHGEEKMIAEKLEFWLDQEGPYNVPYYEIPTPDGLRDLRSDIAEAVDFLNAFATRSSTTRREALEEAAKHPFGFYLSEMDIDAFFNMRDWLRKACEAQGAKMTGGGVGAGQSDIDIELDGCSYNISIRPLPRALQPGEKGK